ncbi:TIGR04282 family arsenosugar biosynthesis glycosyltransferase [Brachyspira alvinipulli]|uniref:TIGR04282 family arsenosugar biosynthesis glycosyltransferase n=1 Tax=Brachyspira alvinipulli TaxID=84379 RepID=UPI0004810698|nr:TIGR04282 family arsenosugar biosynthesis glycosyltransferase [Brachyspira alvinipulli]
MKSNALIIFTRIPIAGKTKTRLQTKLLPEECADIHKCFLKDIYKKMKELKHNDIDIIISYNPDGDLNILKEIFYDEKMYIKQAVNTPNENDKIYNSMKEIFSLGYKKSILIGTDIPEISKENIIDSFNLLDNNDFVFGPSYDGGYYLVGMKEYNDVIVKTNSGTLNNILNAIENINLKYSIIEKRYDIDEYNDLIELNNRINNNKIELENTKNFFKNIGL